MLGLGAGITEEIIARGILFRVVEEAFGTWVGAGLFRGLCSASATPPIPNATWWSSLAIALEAGLLLGMAYAWTRSLWFVIALHAAWNFTQGPLLGIPVSGIAVDRAGAIEHAGPADPQRRRVRRRGLDPDAARSASRWRCGSRAARIAAGRIVPPYWRRRAPTAACRRLRLPGAGLART